LTRLGGVEVDADVGPGDLDDAEADGLSARRLDAILTTDRGIDAFGEARARDRRIDNASGVPAREPEAMRKKSSNALRVTKSSVV